MVAKILSSILIAILLVGCHPRKVVDQGIGAKHDTILVANQAEGIQDKTDTVEAVDNSGCARGQAEPILRKEIYPNAVFKLNEDNHTGTEKVELANGDKVVITNGGCEYYILTFRFETSRFQADTTNLPFWLNKGLQLMKYVEKGIDSNNVTLGVKGLGEFLKTSKIKTLVLGEEIVFDDSEIRNYATLDRVQKINDKTYGIEISFLTGPL
jgi:hypothetical protein